MSAFVLLGAMIGLAIAVQIRPKSHQVQMREIELPEPKNHWGNLL